MLVLVILVQLLPLWSIAKGKTCKPVPGDHSLCACTMSDGSGDVDLAAYANANGTYR